MNGFKPNKNLKRNLMREPGFRADVMRKAQAVQGHAAALAPRKTGDFARSIKVEPTPEGARVYTDIWYGHWVEYGSKNQPPSAPLRRGAQAAGLRLEESGK